jgi:hypothetical protein
MATMTAMVMHHAGGPEVLKAQQWPKPVPAIGQALIRVKAFGLNRSEIYTRQYLYSKTPISSRWSFPSAEDTDRGLLAHSNSFLAMSRNFVLGNSVRARLFSQSQHWMDSSQSLYPGWDIYSLCSSFLGCEILWPNSASKTDLNGSLKQLRRSLTRRQVSESPGYRGSWSSRGITRRRIQERRRRCHSNGWDRERF